MFKNVHMSIYQFNITKFYKLKLTYIRAQKSIFIFLIDIKYFFDPNLTNIKLILLLLNL